jgi:hypothetical protein
MAYSFQQDVPITMDVYREILDRLGPTPAEGLIVHMAIQLEHGLRYIDVWESRALHERFVEDRLHAVVGDVLRGAGFEEMPPEPEMVALDVRDVWLQAARPVNPLP